MTGCVKPSVQYQPVPVGLLIECPLPDVPKTNGALAVAFVEAYDCAARGNEDKLSIKGLMDTD